MANPHGTRKYPNLLARLEANSVRIPFSGCWIWMGYVTKDGYGKVSLKRDGKSVSAFVHRIGYELLRPSGHRIQGVTRHYCHVHSCWNPDHLRRGTQRQNVADNIARGVHTNGWRLYHENKKQAAHIRSILAEKDI